MNITPRVPISLSLVNSNRQSPIRLPTTTVPTQKSVHKRGRTAGGHDDRSERSTSSRGGFQISYPYAMHNILDDVSCSMNPSNIGFSKITKFLNESVVTRTNSHNRKNLSSTDIITHQENQLVSRVSASPKPDFHNTSMQQVMNPSSVVLLSKVSSSPRAPSQVLNVLSPHIEVEQKS